MSHVMRDEEVAAFLREPQPCKPDVLVRLRGWLALSDDIDGGEMRGDLADAIQVIEGLRESDARRLAMINDLKRELAELRPSEGR